MTQDTQYAGTLFVVSAPSGAGKTSLVKALRSKLGYLSVSVSHTTRPQRPGEVEGVDYFFVSPDEFQAMRRNEAFLEHATVFGNSYGTARETVKDLLRRGLDVLLEIDWQGARQIRQLVPDCKTIFILPPSKEVLETRLKGRGQDDVETIERRMRDASSEISHYPEYDFLIINDLFEESLLALESIFRSNRQTLRVQTCLHAKLFGVLLDGGSVS